MKSKLLVLLSIVMFSCIGNLEEKKSNNNENLVEKRILQYIDTQAMGMLDMKKMKIEKITKQDDTTYIAIRIFNNPVVDSELRITARYIIPVTLDSVTYAEDLKVEHKSEGEWVDMGF